jgi:outer membrane protein TolC
VIPSRAFLTLVLAASALLAQTEPSSPAAGSSPGSNPFLGSVPEDAAVAGELPLSLAEAIARGLKHNLGTLLSAQGPRGARAARLEALAQLLPNVNAHIGESSQQVNLAAFGFAGFPGIPQIIGPFAIFDARAYLSQTIFDLRALEDVRAGTESVRAAEYAFRDSRDVVALVVTSLYLQAIAGASRIDAALAQVATAEALYNQAVDFKRNGVVPAIDVLRAQVELQAQQQRLIFVQNEFEKQKLRLGRAVGLPDGQAIRLTDQVPYAAQPGVTVDQAIRRARASRMDYQSAEARLRAAEFVRRAAASGRVPSLAFNTDYGAIGPKIVNSHGTYTASIGLRIPIFQGGRVRADVLQSDAQLEQRRAEAADLRARISFEVRSAMLDLGAAARQVDVAQSAVSLAQQQVTQARDRFAAGVTNNLEVVQAQDALATANENYISSLYSYNSAKAALGRAIGGAEKSIPLLLQGGTP